MPQHSSRMASFAPQKVDQQRSTAATEFDQLDWLAKKKPPRPIDEEHVKRLPSLRRAVTYSMSHADMEPKDAYIPLEMDKAVWSRIVNGSMSFPADELLKLARTTENIAPIIWLAHQVGYALVPLKTELEAQLEEERAARAEAERENALLRSLITGKRA